MSPPEFVLWPASIVLAMEARLDPGSRLPPRLVQTDAQLWVAAQHRPQKEPYAFYDAPPFVLPPDLDCSTLDEFIHLIIEAACCLLRQHWSTLDRAGREILFNFGKDAASEAVSVLLAASYRETIPGPLMPTESRTTSKLDQTVAAVVFLTGCSIECLSEAARHLLLHDNVMEGEWWVMEVIKTACRAVRMRTSQLAHKFEKLSFEIELPSAYGILSLLQGVKDAEADWLVHLGGDDWPYTPKEITYIKEELERRRRLEQEGTTDQRDTWNQH